MSLLVTGTSGRCMLSFLGPFLCRTFNTRLAALSTLCCLECLQPTVCFVFRSYSLLANHPEISNDSIGAITNIRVALDILSSGLLASVGGSKSPFPFLQLSTEIGGRNSGGGHSACYDTYYNHENQESRRKL